MQTPWEIFAKPCMQHTRTIVDYLGRYTHRITLSDSRPSHMDGDHVSFRCKDYRDNRKKVMTLKGTEFLRRFLQHVLPKGFMRVRHFGWLANASRAKNLPLIRAAITQKTSEPQETTVETKGETKQGNSQSGLKACLAPAAKKPSCPFVPGYHRNALKAADEARRKRQKNSGNLMQKRQGCGWAQTENSMY